ncbi:hypothetical protein G6F24_016255 [Rhizopus arrhizus]|nr:hypothetical protein G6F24_016255 [Rhizopus arrhizus]
MPTSSSRSAQPSPELGEEPKKKTTPITGVALLHAWEADPASIHRPCYGLPFSACATPAPEALHDHPALAPDPQRKIRGQRRAARRRRPLAQTGRAAGRAGDLGRGGCRTLRGRSDRPRRGRDRCRRWRRYAQRGGGNAGAS